MTSDAQLLGEIFEITRGDLDTANFPYVSPTQYLAGMSTVRLPRVSQFWKKGATEDLALLRQGAEDFVAGLFGQNCSWVFLLRGMPTEIQCWFGSYVRAIDDKSLKSVLCSHFPDARPVPEQLDTQFLEPLRHSLLLTGTPSLKLPTDSRLSGEQLEKLCRNLFGTNWLYLVTAAPVDQIETVQSINGIAEKIKNIRANYLLKASPIDAENRTAQRCVDLLEAKLKRFERGRVSGMWHVTCSFYTDQPALMARAPLFTSCFFRR